MWKSRVEKGELPLSVYSFSDFARETSFGKNQSGFEIKKYADKLKDFICMLIGCTREQLEDREFKNTPLREEWWYYGFDGGLKINYLSAAYESGKEPLQYLVKPTPRLLMQLLGTEAGRDILHPNIWVNSLFADYTIKQVWKTGKELNSEVASSVEEYPNWIITDMRFPNEMQAVKDRGGITIRVNRPDLIENNHTSETSLDLATFDYTIENDSSIEDLIHTVNLILKKEKII